MVCSQHLVHFARDKRDELDAGRRDEIGQRPRHRAANERVHIELLKSGRPAEKVLPAQEFLPVRDVLFIAHFDDPQMSSGVEDGRNTAVPYRQGDSLDGR